jgi:hypothetical protein
MKIRINGVDADIQLEQEKTVGEILAGLDSWVAGTGHCLSGLSIDGETIKAGSIETVFSRNIDTIHIIDIHTNSTLELFAESLVCILQDIDTFEAAAFEERSSLIAHWNESPAAKLLAEQDPGLFNWAVKTFSGEGSGLQVFRLLIEERLRELQNPAGEMSKTGPLVADICGRLEELPLDTQTGKDARAAETMSVFSSIAEKVFRVFNILKAEGLLAEHITVEDMPIAAYITEFSAALRELLAAYEQHDTVLVGDLAEYEMAPRLRKLHAAMADAALADSAIADAAAKGEKP